MYEGDYQHDKIHGKGKLTFADGDMYEGDYQHDKIHGKGKLTFADGDMYEGDFQDKKIHGDTMRCTNCGTILRKTAHFCGFSGIFTKIHKNGLFFVKYNVLQ